MSNIEAIYTRNVPGSFEKLQKATIAIAGCGGLGSNVAVALVRAGVGKLIIIDFDQVEVSNLNRQHYFQADIGKKKVDALSNQLHNINPNVIIESYCEELTPQNVPSHFKVAQLCIEAFDRAEAKSWLIESWCLAFPGKPIICASGIAGLGRSGAIGIRKSGAIYIIGDEKSSMEIGLCSARVALAAAMQANLAIELIVTGKGT